MKINKAYKFRMYPNINQQEIINKTIGCSRFVYNQMLAKKKENGKLSAYDLIKEIPALAKEYPFLSEVDRCALRSAIFDLENGFKKYYAKQGGYPKFKVKGIKDSYRTNCVTNKYKEKVYESIKIDLKNKVIILPKIKEVKIRGYRNLEKIEGRIINTTIEHIANKYYVSVCVEENKKTEKVIPNSVVGIDVGVKSLVTTSDGEYYGNPNYLKKYERKIKGLQKSLSRKRRGSKNYQKIKLKLREVYRKLQNARRKMNEEIVSKIIKAHDVIITESLKVKEMIEKRNKKLRKSILNATMADIIRRLKYKCEWLGKVFYQVPEFYASSQICSRCGSKNKQLKDINIRKYECEKCGLIIERDLNASINIMSEGLFKNYQIN